MGWKMCRPSTWVAPAPHRPSAAAVLICGAHEATRQFPMAAASHLRRLATAAAPALSRGAPRHPQPLLRLALSSSAPADQPAAAEEAPGRKGEAGSTETDAAKAGERKEGEAGEKANKPTGEIGGPRGPEPTRYGDWERGGRCSDF